MVEVAAVAKAMEAAPQAEAVVVGRVQGLAGPERRDRGLMVEAALPMLVPVAGALAALEKPQHQACKTKRRAASVSRLTCPARLRSTVVAAAVTGALAEAVEVEPERRAFTLGRPAPRTLAAAAAAAAMAARSTSTQVIRVDLAS